MRQDDSPDGMSRRRALECMAWAGTGLVWTFSGGVPHVNRMLGTTASADTAGFSFVQISDSHIGFDRPANPDPLATLGEAVGQIAALPAKPAFLLHTGDISHLSRPKEFDDFDGVVSRLRADIHFVPGEHDVIDEDTGKAYLDRYGKGSKGHGWHAFDYQGVHFIGLVNVFDLKAGGMGNLGAEQLAWLADDLAGRTASTPIVVFAHVPLWTVYEAWGWGTDDGLRALDLLKRFGSVTVLNGHIHQITQKVEGSMTFHTARSTAFPQGEPGVAPGPGPLQVPPERLRSMLGLSRVDVRPGNQPLAIIDRTLA